MRKIVKFCFKNRTFPLLKFYSTVILMIFINKLRIYRARATITKEAKKHPDSILQQLVNEIPGKAYIVY